MAALAPETFLAVTSGERAKRLRSVERILEELSRAGVERGTQLIAVGGGTIGDLVGTAAALYARGMPLIHVPITWLAQADSAIGGKVAVDLGQAKNAAGAFWPPVAVFSELAALRTLPLELPARRDGRVHQVRDDRGSGAVAADRGARCRCTSPRRGEPLRDHRAKRAPEAGDMCARSVRDRRTTHAQPRTHHRACARDRERVQA